MVCLTVALASPFISAAASRTMTQEQINNFR
jgi:hypothetical protein